MLVLYRVLGSIAAKPYHAHLFRRSLATGAGLLGELTSRGFVSQLTK